jgi:hypothetical protein
MLRVRFICGLVAIAGAAGPAPALAARWSLHLLPRPKGSAVSARLNGVSCPTARWCVAVGTVTAGPSADWPLIERWSGARWLRQRTPRLASASLDAVSCTPDRTCVAVGSIGSQGLVARLSHGAWTRRSLSRPLTGVSCAAASDCTAVGGALAWRWDGSHWRSQRTARPRPAGPGGVRLEAISCPSTQSCVAVGSNGCEALVERWNGRRWRVQPTASAGACTKRGIGAPVFTGVSCASSAACTAVGTLQALNEGQIDRPLAERWNGRRWSSQRMGGITGDVSCPSATSCTAVGVQPPLVNAEHWNGRRWAAQRLPVPGTPALDWSLDSVSCASPLMCVAVGGLTDYSTAERPLVAEYRRTGR